jgi:putative CocE/NonD family hydrolase
MRMPPRPCPAPRRSTAVAIAAALALAGSAASAPGAAAAPNPAARAAVATSVRFVDIPVSGGVVLKGNVVTPQDGLARHPLLVLPSSWGLNDLEYLAPAEKLAASGYVVVSYTPRGFWGSGGQIDVAGPQDVADVTRVIDWALAHTPSDPQRIGMAGVSYGAGLSLLGAAFDRRVRAVAAMSAWADLVASLYGDETQHLQSAALLAVAGYLTGRPDSEMSAALKTFFTSDYPQEAALKAWARVRSPQTYLDRLNANHPAVMLANAWGDSLFPPNQLASFFEGLTGAKRLEFRPGDHATAEMTGLFGLPNDTWSDATAWLDHYLKGADNGADRQPAVHLEPQLENGYEDYRSWQAVNSSALHLDLGRESWTGSGPLAGQPQTGWRTTIGTWADSGADGGVIFLSNLAEQFLKIPPTVSVPLLPRAVSAVWQSPAYATTQQVRGIPHLHLGVTPGATHGSLIAYLYDVGPLGIGRLITHAPYTFLNRTPGRSFDVDLDLQATAYDVPAGHHLALVIDAVDPLYITHNPAGAKLGFDSPAGDPAALTVPIR